jgi:hypothetical protein
MKKIFKYIIPVIVGVCSVSCEDSLTEINQDPNNATSANPASSFVSGTAYYGVAIDGFFNELDALFAQNVAGGPGVALIDDERYMVQNADYNNEWSLSYNQALSDLSYTIKNGNAVQSAMADILSVHVWQNVVDHFGDVPYFESLQGTEDILVPKFDEGKAIYVDLILRVDASIAKLEKTVAEFDVTPDSELPGEYDLFYWDEGIAETDRAEAQLLSLENWLRFARSLKLKLLMRQSVTDPSVGAAVTALIAEGGFIESEDQMAIIYYSGSAGQQNPQFARRESGIGQFYVASKTLTDRMALLGDPRVNILFNKAVATGTIVGLEQGSIDDKVQPKQDDYSFPAGVMYGEANDVILMSHWEVYFLRAEAAARFTTSEDDQAMYEEAVGAHFDYINSPGLALYLADGGAYNSSDALAAKLRAIAIQKWISMVGLQEFEGWIETRRFDTPEDHIFTEDIFETPSRSVLPDGVFPSIRLYPQTEISFNPNTPSGREITDKVFWDN